jgi:hypothetical protein
MLAMALQSMMQDPSLIATAPADCDRPLARSDAVAPG